MTTTTRARSRRKVAALLTGLATVLSLSACANPVDLDAIEATGFNLSPDQNRVRSTVNPELAAAVPEAIKADGKLTVGSLVQGSPPLIMMATDNSTPIGAEVDMAQLIADKVGLELDIQLTSWDNWPLKLESSEYELVLINIGVSDQRMQKFDFSSYRGALLAFERDVESDGEVHGPDDISGQRIAVVAGTNQERILLAWNEQLEAEGKQPADLYYYLTETEMSLALSAGRVDFLLTNSPVASYHEATRDDIEIAGRVAAGWPDDTLVGSPTQRGNGFAPVQTAAINELIEEGAYQEALDRWGLGDEALPESETFSLENYDD